MKLKAGVPKYLERFVAQSFTGLGVLLFAAGLILLVYQMYLYAELGVWGKLPASSLFIEPTPSAIRLSDIPTEAQGKLPASYREYIVNQRLNSVVPDWFRSKPSWLADPDRFYGIHNLVSWFLDFLSIPVFLLLIGITLIALSLRNLPRGTEPAHRERAT